MYIIIKVDKILIILFYEPDSEIILFFCIHSLRREQFDRRPYGSSQKNIRKIGYQKNSEPMPLILMKCTINRP